MGTIPIWMKDLIDKHNAAGDDAGIAGVLNFYPLIMRVGRLLLEDSDGLFLTNLTNLVESHETAARESQSRAERFKSLKYPSLTGRNWKSQLHTWMQKVYDALHELESSPKIVVPEPPDFNRAQRRLMKKFKLQLFFVPAWDEKDYPNCFIKFDWSQYLEGADIQRIKLQKGWIAFEVIRKPKYQDGVYPNDRLMEAIGLDSRFNHPHFGKGEGDDLVEDILPKVAEVFVPLGGTTQIQPAEVFNFLGNLFNWATQHTADSFPDLGATDAVEWCANRHGSRYALIVGNSDLGGLACVDSDWRDVRYVSFAFRFMVQF